jgi:hypothetical protein
MKADLCLWVQTLSPYSFPTLIGADILVDMAITWRNRGCVLLDICVEMINMSVVNSLHYEQDIYLNMVDGWTILK